MSDTVKHTKNLLQAWSCCSASELQHSMYKVIICSFHCQRLISSYHFSQWSKTNGNIFAWIKSLLCYRLYITATSRGNTALKRTHIPASSSLWLWKCYCLNRGFILMKLGEMHDGCCRQQSCKYKVVST